MMDSLRYDAPATETELAYLKTVRVGDVRKGVLFPAFDVDLEWTCTAIDPQWMFEGRFCGQPLCHVRITPLDTALQLEVVKEPK
jgi:hypothetical protein